jgi:hypothetical protein
MANVNENHPLGLFPLPLEKGEILNIGIQKMGKAITVS